MIPNSQTYFAETCFSKTGSFRKIQFIKSGCLDPEHNPPNNIHLDPGEYEHVCPSCGHRTTFVVTWSTC